MKRSILLFSLLLAVSQLTMAQSAIENIRKHYSEMKASIEEMSKWDEEYPVPTYYNVQIQENYPGTGKHNENIFIYHEEEEADEGVIFPPKRISFVTSKYNFAARTFYEEYLYDKKGNAEFIYAFNEYEIDDMDTEFRFYFNSGNLIKVIIKQRPTPSGEAQKGDDFKTVYEGVKVPDKYKGYLESYKGKARNYKNLFDAVSNVQCY